VLKCSPPGPESIFMNAEIDEMTERECLEMLGRTSIARLGCSLDDQPYVVPVSIAYEPDYVYVFATLGKKIRWMRTNPKVCLQMDESTGQSAWASVIVTGEYQELREPQFTDERNHARRLMEQRKLWWLTALAERRTQVPDEKIAPIFFRIRIGSVSGLRGVSEG
jgi:nitroimidazol reductase NimA-like FMN-containing flavoprotein (pyridoxamine 5'-phosphate oxidase superfamily)